jgi:hypothetical protein
MPIFLKTGKATKDGIGMAGNFGKGVPPFKVQQIDPATGIWRIADWGSECARGFVSDQRFARGSQDKVIKRTNRATTRKWRRLENGKQE